MNNTLYIKKADIKSDDKYAILGVEIEVSGQPNSLWYKVPVKYSEFLTTETCDAYVVAFLIYAMNKGLDIKSNTPISEKLYFSLTKYLIPYLANINPELKKVNIFADTIVPEWNPTHSGTGISGGVDSLSTIIYHGKEESCSSYRIDTLTLLNTGYYGNEENNSENYSKFVTRAKSFADAHRYSFLTIDSNISNLTKYNFLSAHTYLSCSTIMVLQKYFRTYHYASGYPVFDFKTDFVDPAYYDVFLLDCISTNTLKYISSCTTMSRVEKTELIANHPDIAKSLYVCFSGNPERNCGRCEKCVRTLLAYDSLGRLNEASLMFDVEVYKKHRLHYIGYMLRNRRSNCYYKENFNSFKANHRQIPILSRLFIFIPCRFELITLKGKFLSSNFGKMVYKLLKG